MSAVIISRTDAGLLIHRFVTEEIPILAWFISSDNSKSLKIRGFVNSFTRDAGLCISNEAAGFKHNNRSAVVSVRFAYRLIVTAAFEYSDEPDLPEEYGLGSGLRINMQNEGTLIIAERLLDKC